MIAYFGRQEGTSVPYCRCRKNAERERKSVCAIRFCNYVTKHSYVPTFRQLMCAPLTCQFILKESMIHYYILYLKKPHICDMIQSDGKTAN